MEKETIDRAEFQALLDGKDPQEVFRARDEEAARKAAEGKRPARQKRLKGEEGVGPEGQPGMAPPQSLSPPSTT
jgi:hypothetical protein